MCMDGFKTPIATIQNRLIDPKSKFHIHYVAYIKCNNVKDIKEGLQSPIVKFLDDKTINKIYEIKG